MDKRFERTKLLIGENDLENIINSKVAVIGCGGVGGFVIEALARCGVGTLVIVDYDTIDITNINRQIIALEDTVGNYKVDEFEKRIHKINPNCKVIKFREKFDKSTVDFFNLKDYNYVIDAIDLISAKLDLAEYCYKNDIKLISSMGAGSKLNPFLFRITDIKKTHTCPMAKVMRKELKRRNVNKLTCIWSDEKRSGEVLSANGRNAPASISFVPSCVGLMIASYVIQELR
ncbi:MAG: tRNA threonylcarbamoyladenosine dehydratase [Finegoldia magna]|uniref:tRNA threonylcarbamoyladenosine dehydratase n=1 Tax=Finegoldia magna TaxID=1260 RepID=UPI00290C7B4D|nr:tRNA threonylcarbamoyladenosine dehydratase [Finegoldia magna]MDU7033049.1 tRNA threonylcarbamoyladenosine dehydratase [Finegoldia magna]